jgi:hypothetical protein
MNQDARASVDRRAAAWLGDGPDAAPPGLLVATLSRSREVRQRPGWLAVALGTPTIRGGAARTIEWRVVAVAIGLVLASAALLAVIGSTNKRPVSVIASLTATSAPTPLAPSSSAAPLATTTTSTSTPSFVADPPNVLSVSSWGITIDRPGTVPWGGVESGFHGDPLGADAVPGKTHVIVLGVEHAAWDLSFGPCTVNRCAPPLITVSIARAGTGLIVGTTTCSHAPSNLLIDCLVGDDLWPISLAGKTVKELRQAWLAQFGTATVTRTTLGGAPAVVLDKNGRQTVLAVHGDVLVALLEWGWGASDQEAAAALDGVIANFRFDSPVVGAPSSAP